jgi:hypothetical protein
MHMHISCPTFSLDLSIVLAQLVAQNLYLLCLASVLQPSSSRPCLRGHQGCARQLTRLLSASAKPWSATTWTTASRLDAEAGQPRCWPTGQGTAPQSAWDGPPPAPLSGAASLKVEWQHQHLEPVVIVVHGSFAY